MHRSRRGRRRLPEIMREHRLLAAAAGALCGAVCSIAAAALTSAVVYYAIGSIALEKLTAAVNILIGGFCGGRMYGAAFRRHGLAGGALTGLMMYLILSGAGAVLAGTLPGIRKLLLLVLSGAAGGVCGVNRDTRGIRRQKSPEVSSMSMNSIS